MSYRHLRNARGFFSDYYLGSVFGRGGGRGRKRKLSDRATELASFRFRRLYERVAGKALSASECRERFVRPLLREVFGFLLGEGDNRLYPLYPVGENLEEGDAGAARPVALAWIGGSDDDLNTSRGKAAPRKQLEAALSREGIRYGLLATTERLRLVRAAGEGPQGAYLEIDLAGLAEHPDPESFAVAWKLFGASSFIRAASGELPLEELERESRRHAEKVSEDLKRAVFRAAESLVAGLISNAVARGALADPVLLGAEELARFRDAALLALYRLLFILYAEARDLRLEEEHQIYHRSYSASGLVDELLAEPLRAWPENRSSLWLRCLALFDIYNEGLPPIDRECHIPPRGGDFFRNDTPEGALLAQARLSDATVARLVLDLATTAPRVGVGRERISFRELDIEDLGAVYEGLLEFEPRIATAPTLEIRIQGRLLALSPDEAARLCEAKNLSLRGGSIEWVAGTAAARFHPANEEESEEEEEDDGQIEEEEEEDGESADDDSGDTEAGVRKGGAAHLVRRIERGGFHFVPGPGRKGSGSFYTPLPLVQDLVRHALGPVAIGKSAKEIEALRVLDPACGSGHFLIEAMRFLGAELHRAYVREHGGKAPPEFRGTQQGWDADCDASDADARASGSEARAWCKRRIAERCLFGVDLNPTAVNLAHVALWIESAAGDRPLTYFKHHVRCGNSLLGSWLDRLDVPPVGKGDQRQKDAFAEQLRQDFYASMAGLDERLAEARMLRQLIDQASPADLAREGVDPESTGEQAFKESRRREAEHAIKGARLLFDLRSASLFVPEIWRDGRSLAHLIAQPELLEENARRHSWWPVFQDLYARYRFFHWELEFPEVFLTTERPGFDAVLGNPPWDKVLPERHAFYARVDPLIRAFKGGDLDQRVRDLHAVHPGLEERFEDFQRETKQAAQFLRSGGDFPHAEARSQAAHEDLSKYFLDRAARLAAREGAVGFLVPSVIYNGDGCVGLRRYILTETRIERFYAFENRQKLFPIDSRYKFVSLVFRNGISPEPFEAAFMRHDPEELTAAGEKPWLIRLSREEVERYSPDTFAFLEYRSPRDQKIVALMYAGKPTLGSSLDFQGSWGATFVSWRAHSVIFNSASDKDLWTDQATGVLNSPERMLGPAPGSWDQVIEEMRLRGFWPVFEGKSVEAFLVGVAPIRWWLSVEEATKRYGAPPSGEAAVVYRDLARNTDERTCIAAVLPSGSVGTDTLNAMALQGVPADSAVTVLNSLAFDFLVRLRVAGTHVSFTYMRPLPVPSSEVVRGLPAFPTHLAWHKKVKNVADLDSFWPKLWEVNRAVAEAYGLNAGDFDHILDSFPVMARKRKAFFAYLKERVEEWRRESAL